MAQNPDQILTVAQMRVAEDALISRSSGGVSALMEQAGRGAAEWVWRVAAGRSVTVLCGPGNNGGDGYVIAETLRQQGLMVEVVARTAPTTDAAQNARKLYLGTVSSEPGAAEILVDCLYGTGLTRALGADDVALLNTLAASHAHRIAIDLPSGVASDFGQILNNGLPDYDLTLALGAWKFAHWLMPAGAAMGARRLIDIGIGHVTGAAQLLSKPHIHAPSAASHKYTRGLLGVVGGEMPGAAKLACIAAQRSGAGYVKLLADGAAHVPPELVQDSAPLDEALDDARLNAILIGPGLGRGRPARVRLAMVLAAQAPTVLDADALMILEPGQIAGAVVATPHEGELARLEQMFGLDSTSSKPVRATALAQASGMVIVAKGADTVIAAPDGRLICTQPASTWLSVAGTGDVLAGIIASRLATGAEPFEAACEGVWLHGEAARLCRVPFTPTELAEAVALATSACL